MNILTKLSLTALAVATLAGCASAPLEPPKTEAERVASGSLLHVPVAINLTDFTWHKVTVKASEYGGYFTEKEYGTVTVFTDKKTGKTYDFEGQPVTAEGHRVLTDGYVCIPKSIINYEKSFGSVKVIYGKYGAWNASDSLEACRSSKAQAKVQDKEKTAMMMGPAVLSGMASIAALTYISVKDNDVLKQQQEIEEIIKDDINS